MSSPEEFGEDRCDCATCMQRDPEDRCEGDCPSGDEECLGCRENRMANLDLDFDIGWALGRR